ncbi:MAG: hypothetical protein KW788_04985, partial [Candidatus Doudnabacteria bacterium]|nr:hypothetical protein [Candidatus Doudnabacteria bacterium]
MAQLDINRVELPAKTVTDILNKPEVLGQSPGVNRYISNLRNNLLQNTSLVVDPVGLSLAMY